MYVNDVEEEEEDELNSEFDIITDSDPIINSKSIKIDELNDLDEIDELNDLDEIDEIEYSDYDSSFSTNTKHISYTFNSKITDSHLIYDTNNSEEKFQDVYSNVIPIRRLALSFILSFGIYGYYWFYKNVSYLKNYHDLPISLKFRTLSYIFLPIGNFIVLYDLINTMKPYIEKKGIKSYSPILNLLGFMIFGFSFLGIWFYINVQESFNEYWRLEQSHLPIKRDFSNAEILIIFFVWLGILALIALLVLILTKQKFMSLFSI